MGIDNTAARLLLLLRDTPGVKFEKVLTMGHQRNYITPSFQKRIAKELAVPLKSISQTYSDGFFMALGTESLEILDVSDYENASIIHDLNNPIPDSIHGKFTLVIDIGTSEHIFNVTQSFENIRNLCKNGGHVLMLNPANSWLGHGFYQFSPELFFRAFNNEFGFEVISVYLVKKRIFGNAWFQIDDPSNIGRRGTILTTKRCYVAILASKSITTTNLNPPQQSDYVSAWKEQKVSKLGSIYLLLPWSLRKITDLTVISVRMRIKNRLTPIRFQWKNGKFIAR